MWIFANDAFVSAVEHFDDPGLLVVRARRKGDLERFFGDQTLEVQRHDERDYRYRTIVAKTRFAEAAADKAGAIDYPNFKGSISNRAYHDACLKVWSAMHGLQHSEPD